MKRLFITGASGFFGWNIIQKALPDWEVFGIYFSHPVDIAGVTFAQLDITRFNELKQLLDDVRPDAVIHTAATSDPNYCQENPIETRIINVEVPISIAGLCADMNIPYVFTSSDLVFDGINAPYSEKDTLSPVNVYGEQKRLAEEGLKKYYPQTVICRMPLMYGDTGPVASNFLNPLVRSILSGQPVKLFTDEYRTPLSGRHAAEGLLLALKHLPPVIHLGGLDRISRYEFGFLVAAVLGIERPNLIPCRQKDLDMPAPRPPDVSLDSTRAIAMGFHPGPIKEELEYLRDLCGWVNPNVA